MLGVEAVPLPAGVVEPVLGVVDPVPEVAEPVPPALWASLSGVVEPAPAADWPSGTAFMVLFVERTTQVS